MPKTIEEAEKDFKGRARALSECREVSRRGAGAGLWVFSADCELTWPFGIEGVGEEWYERPVICIKNERYSDNDIGMGIRGYIVASVHRIPDGERLSERDYFRADSIDAVMSMVRERLFRENGLTVKDTILQMIREDDFKPGRLQMNVSQAGMTWWVNPYMIFPGSTGIKEVTIPWCDLLEYLKSPSDQGAMID